jgi:hypothetical protein
VGLTRAPRGGYDHWPRGTPQPRRELRGELAGDGRGDRPEVVQGFGPELDGALVFVLDGVHVPELGQALRDPQRGAQPPRDPQGALGVLASCTLVTRAQRDAAEEQQRSGLHALLTEVGGELLGADQCPASAGRMVGDLTDTGPVTSRALGAARRCGDPGARAATYHVMAMLAAAEGDRRQGEANHDVALADAADDLLQGLWIQICDAFQRLDMGAPRRALAQAEVLLRDSERCGDRSSPRTR